MDHNEDNFFQEKDDIHLEADSNEIAASIFTFNCTPGSKVNLCKRKYLQDDSSSPVLMNFHKKYSKEIKGWKFIKIREVKRPLIINIEGFSSK